MVLNDFIAPDETIRYSSNAPVEYMGDLFDFHLTNKRLIWHKRKGLVFKKDNFIAEIIEKVSQIQFKEEGIFNKKGTIILLMGDRKKEFSGKLKNIRVLYSELQALMNYESD